MPSSVMLTALCGRPFTVAPRVLPPVRATPGSWFTKSNAPRPGSGRLVICFTLIVDATAADCVWTSCVAASTMTVSSSLPISRIALTEAGALAPTMTSFRTAVLNPISATVTVYAPGSTAGIVNVPFDPLTAV